MAEFIRGVTMLTRAKANVGTGKVLPAVALLDGASPFGALQMAGNVYELIDQPRCSF